jgi:superfamily II DNA or RNA helicase
MGLPTLGEPREIELWKQDEEGLIIPRGFFNKLWSYGVEGKNIEDNRLLLHDVVYSTTLNLREYQSPACGKAYDWQQGVIIMPCGAGKTETAMGIVTELKQPTLWITHTIDLLTQSRERAESRLKLSGDQIGIIQGDNYSIGTHMTFATVQTLAKRDLKDIIKHFGCIIIDECHLVFKDYAKARLIESVISQFPAYYRFGMTASEYRSDGLINTMFTVIGPKIYEVNQADLNKAGNVVTPEIEFIETQFQYIPDEDEERLNVQKLLVAMRDDVYRQQLLKNILEKDIVKGDYCIVLGDSLAHLEELKDYVESLGRVAAYVNGSTPKKKREKIMADMKSGCYQYLFATYQLAKLGLDIPRLNKLVFATPKKDRTSIQQAVGRIMRPLTGKLPGKVYDLWDRGVNACKYWAYDRAKVYSGLGCKVIGGPRIRR